MILAKFVAAMLDIAFFTLVLIFLMSQDEAEKEKQSNSIGSIYIDGNMFRG